MTSPILACALALMMTIGLGAPAAAQSIDSSTDEGHPPSSSAASQVPPASTSSPEHQHQPADSERGPLPSFVRPLTDEDRRAAFPETGGHAVHDPVRYFVLFDQLEWQHGGDAERMNIDGTAWIGRDRDRMWLRTRGLSEDSRIEEAQAHVLFGRQFTRWWDLVGGIRQDFRPGDAQTWVAFGVQGLAPYWFTIEATGYVGPSWQTQATLDVEYELLLTNRLILQPRFEVDLSGKSDPERGIGAGLSTTDVGLRLRYELRRELAPYLGISWHRKWLETADLAGAAGESTGGARVVVGVRFWM